MDAYNPVLTNPVLIELIHNPCGGTYSSGLVGTGSIKLQFSVNSVFVKPPFVEYPAVVGESFFFALAITAHLTPHLPFRDGGGLSLC